MITWNRSGGDYVSVGGEFEIECVQGDHWWVYQNQTLIGIYDPETGGLARAKERCEEFAAVSKKGGSNGKG